MPSSRWTTSYASTASARPVIVQQARSGHNRLAKAAAALRVGARGLPRGWPGLGAPSRKTI